MSNRTDIAKIIIELDALDARLRPLERNVSSAFGRAFAGRARAHIASAKVDLAEAIERGVDPVFDLAPYKQGVAA